MSFTFWYQRFFYICQVNNLFLSFIGYASWEGWIGHSLNPIGCLFETLAESSLAFPVTQKPTVLGKDTFLKSGNRMTFQHTLSLLHLSKFSLANLWLMLKGPSLKSLGLYILVAKIGPIEGSKYVCKYVQKTVLK